MLWPYSATTGTYNIPVCWEVNSFFNSTPAERTAVQNAVTNTWEQASLVRFTGWFRCDLQPPPIGIRVNFDSTQPPRAALGTQGRNKTGLMRLDPKMTTPYYATIDDSTLTIFQRCQRETPGSTLTTCLQSQAIHEFGHILGLAHEQNRPNGFRPASSPRGDCLTRNPAQVLVSGIFYDTWGNTLFTDYDPDSMMNYCRNPYFGRTDLSALDKLAVRVYYGKMPTYDSRTGIMTIPRIKRYDGAILTGSFRFIGGAGQGVLQQIGSFQPTTTPSKATATLDAAGVLRMPEAAAINPAGHVNAISNSAFLPISPGLYQNSWFITQPTQFTPVTF